MKTLYESILDDEDILINNAKESTKDWFTILKHIMSDPSCKEEDVMKVFESDSFKKDIISLFRDPSEIDIKPGSWGIDEKHIFIFRKGIRLSIPDIEFAYCHDKSVYGNTNFVMKFNSYLMLNPSTKAIIKSRHAWSALPNKLIKKYKLNSKPSPFFIGQTFLY